jgi:thioredoxin-like negative regulator of GroEL
MPVSKNPRKKSTRSASSPDLATLPDLAALEAMWRELGVGPEDDALGEAQDLAYEAWEAVDGRSRYALARRALKISPFCADAWLILSERPSLSARDRRTFLERAVKAGELALGADGLTEYAGHFWGFLETRPYMRARHSLAEDLWQAGDREAAIGHLREMLALNSGDNQGLR